jgi:hypothetical protein
MSLQVACTELGPRHVKKYIGSLKTSMVICGTNKGSCLIIKVDRPNPHVPPKFGRLYFFLAEVKKGFLVGCRLVIGVDGYFLKGPLKGQLLAAVGRDGNNNMYPIAFTVVKAESRDSWT